MLDKNRIKCIAEKLGIKVTLDSNKPGFISENDKKFYSFSDLNKIIDKTFPTDDLSDKKASNQESQTLCNSIFKLDFGKTNSNNISSIKTFPLLKSFEKKVFDISVICSSDHERTNSNIKNLDNQIQITNTNVLNDSESHSTYYNGNVNNSDYYNKTLLVGDLVYE